MSGVNHEQEEIRDPRNLAFDGLCELVADHFEKSNPTFDVLHQWLTTVRPDISPSIRYLCITEALSRLDGKEPNPEQPEVKPPPQPNPNHPEKIQRIIQSIHSVTEGLLEDHARFEYRRYRAYRERLKSGKVFDPCENQVSRREARKLFTDFQETWVETNSEDPDQILSLIGTQEKTLLATLKVLFICEPASTYQTDLLTVTYAFVSQDKLSKPELVHPDWSEFIGKVIELKYQAAIAYQKRPGDQTTTPKEAELYLRRLGMRDVPR